MIEPKVIIWRSLKGVASSFFTNSGWYYSVNMINCEVISPLKQREEKPHI